ncbi:MAG: hypothetical protein DMG13_08425 [Acidobacteria bacterium]|nr:MAG: hypothetical protein DMG13_08425 [Acidobacteriota bacterium]
MVFRFPFLLLVVFLQLANSVAAQGIEISSPAGFGHVDGEDVSGQYIPVFGVSASGKLGRPEIKVDYEYINWNRGGGNLHMIGFGWLIQAHRPSIRPFFQLGWTFGIQRSHFEGTVPGRLPGDPPQFINVTDTDKFQGLALSAGVTFPLQKRFFLRPEFRWRVIGPRPMMFSLPSLSAGWRF